MFDVENFHDACLSKLTDSSGGHILDLYISDSMQDMLDIDIKSEVATVVGGASEFHTLMNFDLPLLDFDPNSSFNEDSSHSEESSHNHSATTTASSASHKSAQALPKWTERSSFLSSSSSFKSGATSIVDYLESPITNMPSNNSGFIMSQCVNPNSVMPSSSSGGTNQAAFSKVLKNYTKSNVGQAGANGRRTNGYNTNLNEISVNQTNSPCEKKSHLNFSPMRFNANGKQAQQQVYQSQALKINVEPEEEVIVALQEDPQEKVNLIRKNLANDMLMMNGGNQKARSASPVVQVHSRDTATPGSRIELAFGGLNGLSYSRASSQSPLTVHSGRESHGTSSRYHKVSTPSSHHHHGTRTVTGRGSSSTASSPSLYHQVSTSKSSKSKLKHAPNDFPKPAYSYSCLIAMALKNSRSGSLPVSEIYNFMCEHFPYFKTAPNGWKNSVRHNLSLNKCFDKIEKPATNGGQRKGCLWAMNPSKVLKMDEEVQKWSKKDPMAIRRAMVHPENLGALERGELKHGNFGDEDDYPEDDEDEEGVTTEGGEMSDAELDHDDQEIDVGGGVQTITTTSGRRVYRRPLMLSEEFEMEDDVDDEDYEVNARKRRRGSASSNTSMRSERPLSGHKVYQGAYSPHHHHQQQMRQRSRSRSNSPSVKMVLKHQQQRRLMMSSGQASPGQLARNGQLLRLHQIKQEAMDTGESEDQGEEEEEEDEVELDDEDIYPSGGMMPPSRIQGNTSDAEEVTTDEDVKDGNQMMHLTTLIGEQADHLIASGHFDIEATDFYDEIEIADFEVDPKEHIVMRESSSYVVPDEDMDVMAKRQRIDVNYSMQKVQQTAQSGGNRRKMPLVNRIL